MKKYISIGLILCMILAVFGAGIGTSAATELPEPYARTMADAKAAYFYDTLAAALKENDTPDYVTLDPSKGLTQTEVLNGLELFVCDNPEYFWLIRGGRISTRPDGTVIKFLPEYYMTGAALVDAKHALNAVVEEIMAGLPDGSNYDKALYLHDEIARRTAYVQTGYHQTAYGALVAEKAVCAGYAAAYSLLLHRAGIRACSITGDSYDPATGQNVPHAWTLMWLDPSTCVYADVTWDDQGNKGTFHYYFSISKGEIDEGHTPDASLFTLPACNHTSSSYFDANDLTVNDRTPVADVAAMFGPNEGGKRSAVIYYTGSNFANWYSGIIQDLYTMLGGRGGCSYSYVPLKNEYHLTITGNFPTAVTYTVSITRPAGVTSSGALNQTVTAGSAITPVTLRAADGYYFPIGYGISGYGISATRIDYSTVRISGTPTASLTVTPPAPTAKTAEPRPNASFSATGYDTGVLSGLSAGMKYSIDGGVSWIDVSADSVNLNGLDPTKDIRIKMAGNGTTTLDSAIQTIDLSRASVPNVSVAQPDSEGEGGSVNTTAAHEYSTDGSTWSSCGGALNGLVAGSYYIRAKANGTVLASASKPITVNAFVGGENEDDDIPTPPGGNIPDGGEDEDDDIPTPPGGNIPDGGEDEDDDIPTPPGGNIPDGGEDEDGDIPTPPGGNIPDGGEDEDGDIPTPPDGNIPDGGNGDENNSDSNGSGEGNGTDETESPSRETQKATDGTTAQIGGVDRPTSINVSCGSTLDGSALVLCAVALLGSAVTFKKKHW